MSTPGAGIRERLPRRGRYLIPKTTPRRAEIIAAGGVVVVIAHILFAQLTIVLALVFHATTKVSRWRPQWLAAPAAAGVVWALVIGPANAVNGLLAGPQKILAYMAGVGGTPGRALHFGAAYAGMSGWLPRQLPLALITGAAEAALAAWLNWLHTDEWSLLPPRPGLVYAVRRWYVTRNVRLGGVVTRDGACLGAAAPGSWTSRAPRLPIQQLSSAEIARAPKARNSPAGWPGGTSHSLGQDLIGASPRSSTARDPLWARGRAVLSWQEAAGGVLCAGAAGSGTTTTSFQIVHAAIRRRKPVIAVDLYGSRQLAEWFAIVCGATATPLTIVSTAGPGYYEPLREGDPARRAALVMGMIDWSGTAGQYRRSSGAYLNDVLAVTDAAPGDPGTPVLDELLHLLNPAALRARVQHVPGFHPHRDALIKRVQVSAGLLEADPATGAALVGQLGGLRASPIGRWLRPAPAVAVATNAQVDLGRVIRHRGVVLFSLGGADAKAAAMVASLVAQDAMAICAELRAVGVAGDGLLWFEECGDIPPETLTGLVKRGSGADVATILTTTSAVAADQLADHVNAVIMHRMADPVMAERFARLTGGRLVPVETGAPALFGSPRAGGRHAGLPSPAAVPAAALAAAATTAAQAARHADGLVFARKPVVDPEVLFSLGTGEFVFVVKAPRERLVPRGKTIPARLHVAPHRAVSRALPDGRRLPSRGVAVQAVAHPRQPLRSSGEDPGVPDMPPIQPFPSAHGAVPPPGQPLRLPGAAPAEAPESRPWPM